jgi:transcriptional regulator with XRE-family HTH domain
MTLGNILRAWRLHRRLSIETLAMRSGLSASTLETIETGEQDPPVSSLHHLAIALGIPVPWLFIDPSQLDLLTTDGDGEQTVAPSATSADPVTEQILKTSREHRTLFVLLTTLLQNGEPKLLTAAEASLRSLVKQARRSSVPWQSRPSGHFEPPSD